MLRFRQSDHQLSISLGRGLEHGGEYDVAAYTVQEMLSRFRLDTIRPIVLISRNYNADDWEALTFKTEDDWQKAVAIFWDRMEPDASSTSVEFLTITPAALLPCRLIVP